jgi:hypothetical protein
MTALGSKTTLRLTARAERAGLLPRGFAAFYEIFLAGITTSMVEAGKQGALTGSSLVVLRKPGPA